MDFRNLGSIDEALRVIGDRYTRFHYSQFGEDLIIYSLLETFGRLRTPGFYVDVGAFHPTFISNTRMLRHLGWRGINIDGDSAKIDLFLKERPDDISICALVSDTIEELEFSRFAAGALNTADPALRAQHVSRNLEVVQTERMTTRRLADILHEHVPAGVTIDLMNVDAEGLDFSVLKSNDWDAFAPFFLIVEDHHLSFRGGVSSEIFNYLGERRYRLVAHTFVTSIYVRDM